MRTPARKSKGFTLIEAMLALAILSVLAAMAVPSFSKMIERKRLGGAAEAVYEQLMLAKSQAIKRSKPFSVSFAADGSDTWSFGLADRTTFCDPAASALNVRACVISDYNNDGYTSFDGDLSEPSEAPLFAVNSSDFRGVLMEEPTFADDGGFRKTGFNPIRGTTLGGPNGTGAVVLKSVSNDYKIKVVVSTQGRIRLCSPVASKVVGYPDCN